MESEAVTDEAGGASDADEANRADQSPSPTQMIVGWIVAAVLILLAQRDLRKRPPELVRGRVGMWKVVAIVPPGAVAYLLFGRRRAASQANMETPNSIAA